MHVVPPHAAHEVADVGTRAALAHLKVGLHLEHLLGHLVRGRGRGRVGAGVRGRGRGRVLGLGLGLGLGASG